MHFACRPMCFSSGVFSPDPVQTGAATVPDVRGGRMFKALAVAVTVVAAALITGCTPDPVPTPPTTTIDPQVCWLERQTIETAAEAFSFDAGRQPHSVAELIAAGFVHDRGTISQWVLSPGDGGMLVLTAPPGCTSEEPPVEPDPCANPQVIRTERKTIETAAEAFYLDAGRAPSSVDELVEAKYLKSHPKPGGWRIEQSANGRFIAIDPC